MFNLRLRLACFSIASMLYQAQSAPVPPPYQPGDVVYMPPVQQLGAGGQVPHPHVVMGGATQHPGHDHVFAPVTHSQHPGLGHSIPMPQNHPNNPPHGVSGHVLQLETGHSSSTTGQGRFANAHVDEHARHQIAADKHAEAGHAHNNAVSAHNAASTLHYQAGDQMNGQHHAAQALHHNDLAQDHLAEAHNHHLASQGHPHGPFTMNLEHVTDSKHGAHASAQGAHQSAAAAHHVVASHAHTHAANAHGGAAHAHYDAVQRWSHVNPHQANQHVASYNAHVQSQIHHQGQAAAHLDPTVNHAMSASHGVTAASQSHQDATHSTTYANGSHPPHHGGGHY